MIKHNHKEHRSHACHKPRIRHRKDEKPVEGKIALVGSPNVGKSVVFNRLTGRYVTISNYPGTTVDVSRGRAVIEGRRYEVIDTPGMYSLHSITAEEQVTKRLIFEEKPDVVVHVVDARNLERMLPLTFQLIEAGLPLILELNMIDEAEAAGQSIDQKELATWLGIPVVTTAAVSGRGLSDLRKVIAAVSGCPPRLPFSYDEIIEKAVDKISNLLNGRYELSKRAVSLLLLQGDPLIEAQVRVRDTGGHHDRIAEVVTTTRAEYSQPLNYVLAFRLQREASKLAAAVTTSGQRRGGSFAESLSHWMMHPLSGGIILLLVIYFGLYKFVGGFGAGIVVDFIEETIFGEYLNPWLTGVLEKIIPIPVLRDLFVGDYGVITLGVTYAIAIILPIVGTFFLAFSVIEDSGYLPRLAMLIDRLFKLIGLNGRAVIPIVLGFGCDTMATVVTRTQQTVRERVLTTLLLALAIPCSAQLGVILGILSPETEALFIWAVVVILVFFLVGFVASRLLPGARANFYMELPPLRLPKLSNILIKTYTRLEWYFKEVMPFFLLASVFLWLGDLTGLFGLILAGLRPVVEVMGVPGDAAVAFLYGFFRRDFGAAGLYDLYSSGVLAGVPLVVSAVVITLFVPCIAQFLVMAKERGWKTAIAIAAFILPFTFVVGWSLNKLLTGLGVTL